MPRAALAAPMADRGVLIGGTSVCTPNPAGFGSSQHLRRRCALPAAQHARRRQADDLRLVDRRRPRCSSASNCTSPPCEPTSSVPASGARPLLAGWPARCPRHKRDRACRRRPSSRAAARDRLRQRSGLLRLVDDGRQRAVEIERDQQPSACRKSARPRCDVMRQDRPSITSCPGIVGGASQPRGPRGRAGTSDDHSSTSFSSTRLRSDRIRRRRSRLRHGDRPHDGVLQPVDVVRVDQHRASQFVGGTGELAEHEHAVVVEAGRHVLLRDEVHAVAQRGDEHDVGGEEERDHLLARVAVVQIADRRCGPSCRSRR